MTRRSGTTVRARSRVRTPPPTPDPAIQAAVEAVPLSATQRAAIQRRYGAETTATLRSHPYRLLQDIPRLSFPTVDTLARRLGAGKTSPSRLQAGILAVLHQAIRQGHTGLPMPMPLAIRRATRLLGVPRTLVEDYCLRSVLAGGGTFVVEEHETNTFLTSRALRQVEERVAEMVAEHVSIPLLPLTPDVATQAAQVATEVGLNAEQAAARRTLTQGNAQKGKHTP